MFYPVLRNRLRGFAAVCFTLSCSSSELSALNVVAVDPPQGDTRTATQVKINGSAFFAAVHVDLDSKRAPTPNQQFRARLGNVELTDVTLVNSRQLNAIVPAMLPVGHYSLQVFDPHGRNAILDNAFEVISKTANSAGGFGGTSGGFGGALVSGGAASVGGSGGKGNSGGFGGTGANGAGGTGGANSAGGTVALPPGTLASTFVDDFEDGVVNLKWLVTSPGIGCNATESNGTYSFKLADVDRCSLTTSSAYDLRNDAVSLSISPITNYYPPLKFFFRIVGIGGNFAELAFQDGQFVSSYSVNGMTTVLNSAYDPAPDYWRIRDANGTLFLESSGSGSSWDIEQSFPEPFDVARVQVSFGVDIQAKLPQTVGISVRAYNTLQ